MKANPTKDWPKANQQYLMEALARVEQALRLHGKSKGSASIARRGPKVKKARPRLTMTVMPTPSALDTLCATFGLSPFERDVLLLCAGMELDSKIGPLCALAQNEPSRPWPTWSLALAALPDAHWSALSPVRPLRYWRLIEIGVGQALTTSPLRIDERLLHYLTGLTHVDERLMTMIDPVPSLHDLVPSHQTLAQEIATNFAQASPRSALPFVQLLGDENAGKAAVAAAACATVRLNLYRISASLLPTNPADLEAWQRLWEREAALTSSALLLDCDELDSADSSRESAVNRLIESTSGILIVSSHFRRKARQRPSLAFDVQKPTTTEQRGIWRLALGDQAASLNGQVDQLVSQFNLNASGIRSACAAVRATPAASGVQFQSKLWNACRAQARPRLDDLAQSIPTLATWDDLILPQQQTQTLQEIARHVRQRSKVYDTWGFAGKSTRGLGISALFSGASGTGKTMAAEVLANELRLDLYRIDLSQVISKYIGETEKNLRRVFAAAEDSGAVLLFDEADALFGKRSEVKDSHDRYANIEVSYLLQRMEAYRGLAVLTTNLKGALDPAFQRRIRFVVQFPFPDAEQRGRIWQRVFPTSTPTEKLEVNQLARLNVAGGNIHNIALNAAFLAANAKQPVRMEHLLRAARSKYTKLEKPLTDSEIGGWM